MEIAASLAADARRLDPFPIFASHSPHEVRDQVARALCPHQMDVGTRTMDAALHRADIGGVPLMRLRYGAETAIRPTPLRNFVLLQMTLAGELAVDGDTGHIGCAPGDGLILESIENCRLAWTADCEQLIVPIRRTALVRAWETQTGTSAPHNFGFQRSFSLAGESGQALAALLRYLLIASTIPSNWYGRDSAAELLAGHLLGTCVSAGHAGARSGAIPYYVRRAERMMHERIGEDMTLATLAAAAGVSIRTLTGGFRDYRNTSPLARLREIRLDRVRAELSKDGAPSVTEVALKFGLNHLGRFASVYRERFGESPAATLARTRDERLLDAE